MIKEELFFYIKNNIILSLLDTAMLCDEDRWMISESFNEQIKEEGNMQYCVCVEIRRRIEMLSTFQGLFKQ